MLPVVYYNIVINCVGVRVVIRKKMTILVQGTELEFAELVNDDCVDLSIFFHESAASIMFS